jgi:hypothetical protein
MFSVTAELAHNRLRGSICAHLAVAPCGIAAPMDVAMSRDMDSEDSPDG